MFNRIFSRTAPPVPQNSARGLWNEYQASQAPDLQRRLMYDIDAGIERFLFTDSGPPFTLTDQITRRRDYQRIYESHMPRITQNTDPWEPEDKSLAYQRYVQATVEISFLEAQGPQQLVEAYDRVDEVVQILLRRGDLGYTHPYVRKENVVTARWEDAVRVARAQVQASGMQYGGKTAPVAMGHAQSSMKYTPPPAAAPPEKSPAAFAQYTGAAPSQAPRLAPPPQSFHNPSTLPSAPNMPLFPSAPTHSINPYLVPYQQPAAGDQQQPAPPPYSEAIRSSQPQQGAVVGGMSPPPLPASTFAAPPPSRNTLPTTLSHNPPPPTAHSHVPPPSSAPQPGRIDPRLRSFPSVPQGAPYAYGSPQPQGQQHGHGAPPPPLNQGQRYGAPPTQYQPQGN